MMLQVVERPRPPTLPSGLWVDAVKNSVIQRLHQTATSGGLTLVDFFCGAGGSSQGAHAVPGVEVKAAANHWAKALESHALNFPNTRHIQGDIRDMDLADLPPGDLFWASPECPKWSKSRGRKRDFDNTAQHALGEELEPVTDEEAERSRALMVNVPDYLEAMVARGKPVLAGVVENVTDCREWDRWDWWINRIRNLGYKVKVIALNSMHAEPTYTPRAPQSRNRLYVAYWLKALGRDPDWDKWLRPTGYCPNCDEVVALLQAFKDPRKDMGDYGAQYVYRCPHHSCRGQIVEPGALPALVAIDWNLAGTPIGSRKKTAEKPEGLAPKTIARIRAGLERYAVPVLAPSGGTWRDDASPVIFPMPTRTATESDGLAVPPFVIPMRSGRNRSLLPDREPLATIVADGSNHGLVVPPLLIPTEGRDGKVASSAAHPLRTQTARNETGLAWLPFIAELRGGSSDARSVTEALAAVTASGNHHGLVTPPDMAAGQQALVDWQNLLVPYYGNGVARHVLEPVGTMTTRDRWSLVSGNVADIDIAEVLFRMLEPHEIARAMAFIPDYQVVGNKRQRVRQLGNAVTPPVAEVLVSALVEAITGEDMERAA